MTYIIISNDELYHHGVKGMHWGVRRYQNKDGSLTSAGRKRYTDYKPAIKEYRDSYDKASSMNDAADAKWRDVQAARKELGRTAIGRTIASARNKTEAAKKYNRMYDEWSKMQDDADEQWRDADEKYKHTGGNRLTRIANNIRYDTKLGSAKSGEKKQLTDEEKAARNAKIKKAAVAVGAVAATAALAYVGHKYVKHLDSETSDIVKKARNNAITDNFEMYEYDMRGAKSLKDRNNAEWQMIDRNRRVRANSDEKDYSRDIAKSVVKNDLQNARDRILRRKPKDNAYRDQSVLDATRKLHNRVDTEMYLKDYLARVDKDRNYRDAAAEALLEKRFKKYGSVNL